MHRDDVLRTIGHMNLGAVWSRLGVPMPPIDEHTDFFLILFAVMRNCLKGPNAKSLREQWSKTTSSLVEANDWAGKLARDLPSVSLPRECQTIRKTTRGDDKIMLTANRFLAKRTGYAMAEDVLFKVGAQTNRSVPFWFRLFRLFQPTLQVSSTNHPFLKPAGGSVDL